MRKWNRWGAAAAGVALAALFPGVALAAGPEAQEVAIALNTVWTLLAGFLVFLMHAGFTAVETGFTRSKNTVNIIMKNFLTIVIGVLAYYAVGFALMFGQDAGGFIGTSGFALLGTDGMDFGIPFLAFWFFQAVFAATSATIVSGAMAERTRFITYCVFTVIITSVIYPIVGHWIWGGGWLAKRGFIDFAGSTVVHGVGGWSALVGASLVGARIGKYVDGRPQAIPGHNLPLGAMGVLLLWFGWFGFNPGSTLSGMTPDIALIAVTTLLAGAAATVTTMITSWIRYGKPDLSLTLNGALGGLVGITAGAAAVAPTGALAIGALAGPLLVAAVEFLDYRAKVDDPVGAIPVHAISGAFGTISVGLFATRGGLFYGGGTSLLATQLIGVAAVAAFTITVAFVTFKILDAILGLRVSREEEIEGLDIQEHGVRAYSGLTTPVVDLGLAEPGVAPAHAQARVAQPALEGHD